MSETAVTLVEKCKQISIDEEISELLWSVDSLVSHESPKNNEDNAEDDDALVDGLDSERRRDATQLFHRYECCLILHIFSLFMSYMYLDVFKSSYVHIY